MCMFNDVYTCIYEKYAYFNIPFYKCKSSIAPIMHVHQQFNIFPLPWIATESPLRLLNVPEVLTLQWKILGGYLGWEVGIHQQVHY